LFSSSSTFTGGKTMRPRFYAVNNQNGLEHVLRTLAGELAPEQSAQTAAKTAAPAITPLDIFEHAERFEVWLDVPGVNKEDVKLSLEGETLRVQGERPAQAVTEATSKNFRRTERWTGPFSRTITLPNTVDGSRIEAKLEDGVLRIVLPKRDQAKARSIPITG
jgi:HSP20 family protein